MILLGIDGIGLHARKKENDLGSLLIICDESHLDTFVLLLCH